MTAVNEVISTIEKDELTLHELVLIFRVVISKININSFAGMAKSETLAGRKITPDGVKKSNRFAKELIGDKTFVISGIRESDFPF